MAPVVSAVELTKRFGDNHHLHHLRRELDAQFVEDRDRIAAAAAVAHVLRPDTVSTPTALSSQPLPR
jgi:hypothetical protein